MSYCAVSIRGILVEIFHFSLRVPASIKATRGILCVLGVGMGNTVLGSLTRLAAVTAIYISGENRSKRTTKPYRLKFIKHAFGSV